MNTMNAIMMGEKKVVYGGLSAYRSRGDYLRRLELYPQAKVAYDEAHAFSPNDVKNLMGRSLSCSMAMQSKQAYDNAKLALQLEPNNLLALKVQARAMYTMTEFERSIVTNARGNRIRPSYFKEGVNEGLETVEDCIGTRAGQVLCDYLPLIKRAEASLVDESPPPLRVSRIPRQELKPKISQKESHNAKTISRVLATKYLGPMANDKFFIEGLLKDKRMISANKNGNLELHEITKDGYQCLADRQELLRASRPYYAMKQVEKTESSHQTEFLQKVLAQERLDSTRMADRLLRQVKRARRITNISAMVSVAERMQIYLDKKTERTLPLKDTYVTRLYTNVGSGYMSQYHLSNYHTEEAHRDRIAFLMGLPLERPKSYDSVRANFPFKYGDIQSAIEKQTASLEMCENATQRCWLYFELSRLYATRKNFTNAKYYGKQCQYEAEANELPVWWMNGCFAIMSVEFQQGNASEVKVLVKEAQKWVVKLDSSSYAVGIFLNKCSEIAVDCVLTKEETAIRLRERQILRSMVDPERVEQKVLFKRIWTVPPGRRFCVMPRKRVKGSMGSERQRYRQPELTVVPGQTPTLPMPPKSVVKGRLAVDLYS